MAVKCVVLFLTLLIPISFQASVMNESMLFSTYDIYTDSGYRGEAADFLPNYVPSLSEKTTLVGCILMEKGETNDLYDYNKAAAAIELAVDWVNENIFPTNLTLETVYVDIGTFCTQRNQVVSYAMDLWNNNISCNVYFGPACGSAAENLNDFAEFVGVPIFGLPAASVGIKAPISRYELFIRPSITHTTLANAFLRFLAEFNYRTPLFLYDTYGPFYREMGTILKETIQEADMELYYSSKFRSFDSSNADVLEIHSLLMEASKVSRVIILLADAMTVRKILVTAHKTGMTNGDYVYVAVELFQSEFWGKFVWQYYDDNDTSAREAFRSLLILSIKFPTEDSLEIFWINVQARAKKNGHYVFSKDSKPDIMVVHAYDAVYLYASVVVTLLSQTKNFLSGRLVASMAGNFTFFSVPLNRPVLIDQNGDRVSTYVFRGLDPVTGAFGEIFVCASTSDKIVRTGRLHWPNGDRLPPNTPLCGFDGNALICQQTNGLSRSMVALVVVIPLLFLTALLFAIYHLMKRLSMLQDPFWWRILLHDLRVSSRDTGAATCKRFVPHTNQPNGNRLDQSLREKLSVAFIQRPRHTPEDTGEGARAQDLSELVAKQAFSKEVTYKGIAIGLMELPEPKHKVSKKLLREIAPMKFIHHSNLHRFIGIVVDDGNSCLFTAGELCTRGSLQQLLMTTQFEIDNVCKKSLIADIVNGMHALHASAVLSHGNLTSTTCLVDSQLTLKITDYSCGIHNLTRTMEFYEAPGERQTERDFPGLLWRAPELLRRRMEPAGTQKGDVYSFAILIQQIILRAAPFRLENGPESSEKAREIIFELKHGSIPPLRPLVPVSACTPRLYDIMEASWDENPAVRPSFSRVRGLLGRIGNRSGSLVDSLTKSMEKYALNLEHQVEEQTRHFMEEKKRSEKLLSNLLPKSVIEIMQSGRTIYPETFSSTTVYFSDIPGFTDLISKKRSPKQVVSILNSVYNIFDDILEDFDVYKVETINDAYLVVSGLPVSNGLRHASEVVAMAMRLIKNMDKLGFLNGSQGRDADATAFELRVGVNSGPCVAGVVGLKMPRYCLFGDTINTAARMQTNGTAGRVHSSPSAMDVLERTNKGQYLFVSRGEIMIKIFLKGQGTHGNILDYGEYDLRQARDRIALNSLNILSSHNESALNDQ